MGNREEMAKYHTLAAKWVASSLIISRLTRHARTTTHSRAKGLLVNLSRTLSAHVLDSLESQIIPFNLD